MGDSQTENFISMTKPITAFKRRAFLYDMPLRFFMVLLSPIK